MRRTSTVGLCVVLVMVLSGTSVAQGPPRRRGGTAEQVLKRNVDLLLKSQEKDGHWSHNYNLGMTALAVLALKHSNDPRAATAVARGADYLAQAKTEYKVYSAGTTISALYQIDPRVHRRTIDKYARLLIKSQLVGHEKGMFGYPLVGDPARSRHPGLGRGDNSNTQFGVLGLLFAQRAGHQVPSRVWKNVKHHYTSTQNADGGWGYRVKNASGHNMTLAGAVSLYIAEEQLALAKTTGRCQMAPPSRGTEAAMKWVGRKFTPELTTYGLYALERLGILTGRSEFSGHYWYREGAKRLLSGGGGLQTIGGSDANAAFIILFLSRGKEPIIINKLKYYGDWNNCNYDVKHMTEYISDKMQSPMQWRIVTLESKLEDLLKVPILHLNGVKGPQFSDNEKIKLREYVLKGGVIMAQACRVERGLAEFDENFRALVAECFPEGELEAVSKTHLMFKNPRRVTSPPKVEVLKIEGRIAVVYIDKSLTLDWHRGGSGSKASFDAGVNIVFYLLKQSGRLGAGAKPIRDAKRR